MSYAYDKLHKISSQGYNRKASDEGGDLNFHNGNLFDQNEDASGEIIDLATGRRIDNSTDRGLGHLVIREVSGRNGNPDILGEVPKAKTDQAADEWMKSNGFKW